MKSIKTLVGMIMGLALLFNGILLSFGVQNNDGSQMVNIIKDLQRISSSQINNSVSRFSDMGNHWSKDSVGKLTFLGIIGGYQDGTFKPNRNIQVDEFIKLVVTAMGYNPSMGTGYWAEPFIQIAKNEKLIGNNEFSNFRRPITRQEMAKIIVNATLIKESEPNENFITYLKGLIKDYGTIKNENKQHVLIAYGMGLISGYTDGSFKPLNNSTRAEASVVIIRFLDERTRNKIIVNEKDMITLRNNMTGEMTTVYPPHSNPEVIRIAHALRDGASKSKGYSSPSYNGFSNRIFANLFEIEEHKYSDNSKYYHGSISINITDDVGSQQVPYSIIIWNIEETKRLHNEVIKEVLKSLFEGESARAIYEYEKYLELALTNNNGFRSTVILNDRSIHFLKDGAGKQLSISISIKGFRYK